MVASRMISSPCSLCLVVLALSAVPSSSSFQQAPMRTKFSHPTQSSSQPYPKSFSPNDHHHHSMMRKPTNKKLRTSPPSSTTTTTLHSLTPTAALSAIGSPLGSIAVLAFVILVHEGGHFLAARSMGINVDEFSVGVGPRILGVQKRVVGDEVVYAWIDDDAEDDGNTNLNKEEETSDGIEFSLRALPLGGYVRFPDNYNRTLAFELEDEARRARNEARQMRIEEDGSNVVVRFLEGAAARSVVLNVLSLGLLSKWVERRVEVQLKSLEEEVEQLSLVSKNSISSKGTWWSSLPWVSNDDAPTTLPTGEATNIQSKLQILQTATKPPSIEYYTDPNLLQNRPWHQRAIVLSGGVVFNILLAFTCYFGELTGGKGLPMPIFDSGAVVSSISRESPSFGILREGDVIVGINNEATSLANAKKGIFASQAEISKVISSIHDTPQGESVQLTIIHTKNTDSTTTTQVVSISPKPKSDTGLPSIGVMLAPNYLRTDIIRASSPIDALTKASSAVYEITSLTASSIVGTLMGLLFGKGLPAGTSMSGPIGVVKTGAQIVSTSDVTAIVAFAASISINLAVVNSLPLPALDGGQLMFVLAEAAAGRKIDQRVQEGINAGALIILLFISFGTAVGDVTSIFGR